MDTAEERAVDPWWRDRVLLWVIGGSALVLLALVGQVDVLDETHRNWPKPWDHQKYGYMADHPFDLRLSPFGWRILGPLLASVLPVANDVAFRIVGFSALWGTSIMVFLLGRRARFSDAASACGSLVYLGTWWSTGYLLYNPWLPDALAFLVVAVLALLAMDRKAWQFAAVLVVGVLVKEQVLLAVPLWWTLSEKPRNWRPLLQAGALALPALVVIACVRFGLPARNSDPSHIRALGLDLNAYDRLPQDQKVLFEKFGRDRLEDLPAHVFDWTRVVFGTWPLLGLVDLRRAGMVLLRWSPFLAGVYAQTLVASNTHRLVALAFPVVALLVAGGVDRLRERGALTSASAIGIGLAAAGVAVAFPNRPAPWWTALAIVGLALVVEATRSAIGSDSAGSVEEHPTAHR